MKTMIRADYVIGYQNGGHVVYPKGELVFEGDSILFCGRGYTQPCDREVDGSGCILSPGFIDLDALVDIDHGILDVAVPHSPHDKFQLSMDISRTVDLFGPDFWQTKQRLSYSQLLLNGITTGMPIAGDLFRGWAETYEEMADAAAIAEEIGIRMYLGPSYRLIPRPGLAPDPVRGEESMRQAIRYCHDFDNTAGGLVRAFLSPCQIMNLSPEMLRETGRLSRSLGVPVRLHSCESLMELEYLHKNFGQTPIQYLEDMELLGERTLIPHAIYADQSLPPQYPRGNQDLRLLADSHTSVVHTPIAESHGGLCLYSFGRYKNAGINLTLGTDTHPADMLQNMNFAWNLNRLFEHGDLFNACGGRIGDTGTAVRAADIFDAATVNAARALCREDIGRLAPGAKADCILVDITSLRTLPVEDPIRTLIMNTTGANVRHVFVNGRQVVEEGRVVAIKSLQELQEGAQQCFARYKAGWQQYDQQHRPPSTFFPDSYPVL